MLITTSRRPSRRTRTLAKELSRVVPGSIKINRGKMSLNDIKMFMIKKGFSKLLIIETRKGNPSILQFLTFSDKGFTRNLIIKLNKTILQRDKGQKMKIAYILGVKAENINSDLLDIFHYFLLGVYTASDKESIKGYMEVKYINDEITIGFMSSNKKRVYPLMKGTLISYERI